MGGRRGQRDEEPTGGQPTGGEPAGGEFRPEEFEEIELPTEAPAADEELAEFAEPDLTTGLGAGLQAPSETLLAARDQLEQQLLLDLAERALTAETGTEAYGPENIQGVGIGEKLVGDRPTGQPCVTVYVVRKAPSDVVEAAALAPAEVNGVPVDVVELGEEFRALPFRGRFRPAPGGVSVGHFRITAGTIGCLVRRGNALFILSNNHVLANSNNSRPGDPILQPGPADGGRVPADVIARLARFIPIRFGGAPNEVDCAIAQTSPGLVTPLNRCFGRISASPVPARRDLLVQKCGRTTQFTRGRITDVNATVRVGFGSAGTALFRNQIIIASLTTAPFSAGGDSGSLIVTTQGVRPVGLLFAGGGGRTIANPIGAVLAALGVTIVA